MLARSLIRAAPTNRRLATGGSESSRAEPDRAGPGRKEGASFSGRSVRRRTRLDCAAGRARSNRSIWRPRKCSPTNHKAPSWMINSLIVVRICLFVCSLSARLPLFAGSPPVSVEQWQTGASINQLLARGFAVANERDAGPSSAPAPAVRAAGAVRRSLRRRREPKLAEARFELRSAHKGRQLTKAAPRQSQPPRPPPSRPPRKLAPESWEALSSRRALR